MHENTKWMSALVASVACIACTSGPLARGGGTLGPSAGERVPGATELFPREFATVRLSLALEGAGRLEEALQVIDRSLALFPNDDEAEPIRARLRAQVEDRR